MKPYAFLFVLLTIALDVSAQDKLTPEYDRSWAVDFQVGGAIAGGSSVQGSDLPLQRVGSSSNSGLLTKLHLEKYLGNGHYSVKAGYEHEEINALEGDFSSDFSELSLGGRWYPAPNEWVVQPYAGADMLWNFNAGHGPFSTWASTGSYEYSMEGYSRTPHFSIGPVVGADLYIFSCIAVQVEYGYRWAINARADGHYAEGSSSRTAFRHARLHRHALSIGLKVTFPFSINQHDSNSLLDLIFGD